MSKIDELLRAQNPPLTFEEAVSRPGAVVVEIPMRPERPPAPWASWIDYDRSRDDARCEGMGFGVIGPDGLARRVDPMKVLTILPDEETSDDPTRT